MDFSNVKKGDTLKLYMGRIGAQLVTVTKVFKKHFRVSAGISDYEFYFTGKPKTKTVMPMTISNV